MDRSENFIVPPPGLLPSPASAQPDAEPAHRGDTTEPFPKFVPRGPLGATISDPPSAPTERASHPAPVPASTWILELPDGSPLTVDGAILVGRNPAVVESTPGARLVALSDPGKSLSKTHSLLVPLDGGVGVTDLHSTNGVAVTTGDSGLTVLEPGIQAVAPEGSIIELGSVRVRVKRPPGRESAMP